LNSGIASFFNLYKKMSEGRQARYTCKPAEKWHGKFQYQVADDWGS